MNAIFAALAAAALAFGAANAQSTAQGHGNPQSGFQLPPPPVPQIGGPSSREFPGQMQNHLAIKPNGEIESVGPNRHDFANHYGAGQGNFAAERNIPAAPSQPDDRHWSVGEHLPSSGSDREITRYGLYGLTTPPPGTVWVRRGHDAVLVNRTSREIIRTQYGLFH